MSAHANSKIVGQAFLRPSVYLLGILGTVGCPFYTDTVHLSGSPPIYNRESARIGKRKQHVTIPVS